MKLSHACPPSCKQPRVDLTTSEIALQRARLLRKVDQLVAGGTRRDEAIAFMEVRSSTYYDWRRAFRRGVVRAFRTPTMGAIVAFR